MPKVGYILGAALVVLVVAVTLFYKTSTAPSLAHEPAPPTGEFAGVSLNMGYALTVSQRERGLGGRESVPDDYGMLFVFPKSDYYGFWMRDMQVPLDIFWFDDKGRVVFVLQDVAPSTYPHVFYPSLPAQYVLETAAGFAERHAVTAGTPLLLKNFPTVSQ